ncbi:MAG TPA: hypothetical protein DEP42_06090 [Ruminococcaceae bacterium]|nr:hypothetical protein [Oscillospiraceae bacterium]
MGTDAESKNVFSNNLKYYIGQSKKTREQICKDLSIPYSTFTDWVNGNKYPRIDKIEALANYFKINKSDLIEEHELDDDIVILNRGVRNMTPEQRKKLLEVAKTFFAEEFKDD